MCVIVSPFSSFVDGASFVAAARERIPACVILDRASSRIDPCVPKLSRTKFPSPNWEPGDRPTPCWRKYPCGSFTPRREQSIHASGQLAQERLAEPFEFGARHLHVQVDARLVEGYPRIEGRRQLHLRGLDGAKQVIAEVVHDQIL